MSDNKGAIPREDQAVLVENHEELVRQLKATDIMNSLFQRQVLDIDDLHEIRQEEKREGRRAGVEKLLLRIHSSGPRGFDMFIESLKYSGYTTLAKRLQESSLTITNRTDQEKTKGNGCFNVISEMSDEKSRGKIPKRHQEILQRNYLSIVDNIRVDDIVDYLYSEEVIDFDQMDAIRSKLRSEGNREAIRYLINDILSYSSDKALQSFVNCLRLVRYFQLAEQLQSDIDSVKPCGRPSTDQFYHHQQFTV